MGTPPVHANFFLDQDLDGAGSPDDDFYSFATESGETYIIETLNLLNGGDTKMYLIDSDGSTDTWWTVAEKLLAKNELSGDKVRAIVADFEAKK